MEKKVPKEEARTPPMPLYSSILGLLLLASHIRVERVPLCRFWDEGIGSVPIGNLQLILGVGGVQRYFS